MKKAHYTYCKTKFAELITKLFENCIFSHNVYFFGSSDRIGTGKMSERSIK